MFTIEIVALCILFAKAEAWHEGDEEADQKNRNEHLPKALLRGPGMKAMVDLEYEAEQLVTRAA